MLSGVAATELKAINGNRYCKASLGAAATTVRAFFAIGAGEDVKGIASDMPANTCRGQVVVLLIGTILASGPRANGASASTATTLNVSASSVAAGTAITLTATVTRTAFPGPVTTNVILGQVAFCNATAAHCDGAAEGRLD